MKDLFTGYKTVSIECSVQRIEVLLPQSVNVSARGIDNATMTTIVIRGKRRALDTLVRKLHDDTMTISQQPPQRQRGMIVRNSGDAIATGGGYANSGIAVHNSITGKVTGTVLQGGNITIAGNTASDDSIQIIGGDVDFSLKRSRMPQPQISQLPLRLDAKGYSRYSSDAQLTITIVAPKDTTLLA